MIHIVAAESESQINAARRLFEEYAASLDFSLCFQHFAEELATLPGAYAPPAGCLLLAECDGEYLGCVALRPLGDGVAEMKRLFVAPAARGSGLGRQLVAAILDVARTRGYRAMRLDTVPSMAAARKLYEAAGFVEIPPYCDNPIPGAIYLELRWNDA
jgi:GNAT superfamily N-acetyltransferase